MTWTAQKSVHELHTSLFVMLAHKGFFSPLGKREFREDQFQSIPHPTMQNHDLLCSLVDGCGEIVSVGGRKKMVTSNS